MIQRFFLRSMLLTLVLLTSLCTKEEFISDDPLPATEVFSLDNIDNPTIRNFLDYSFVSSLNPHLIDRVGPRNEEGIVHDAIEAIYEIDKKQGFIEAMVKKYGYPIWDKSEVLPGSGVGEVLFTPLAFIDGDEITSFLVGIPWKDSFRFRLVKKEKIDKYIGKDKPEEDWKNLGFSIIHCVVVDSELFGNPRQQYIDWLLGERDIGLQEPAPALLPRDCEVVTVEKCYEVPQVLVPDSGEVTPRSIICDTYYEYICDDPNGGGDGSCQECGDGGGSGSGGGGGSDGGSGGTSTDPDYPQDSDPSAAYENLDESQYYYLRNKGFTEEEIGIIDDLWAAIQTEISDIGWYWPSTEEEWDELAEILQQELLNVRTLTELVVPGLADIKSALKNFKNESYWGAAFDLSMALVDLLPGKKLAGLSLAVAVKVRRTSKVLDVFNIVRKLGNGKVYRGFKKTIFKEYKNPHIFRVDDGHLGDPDFDSLVSWAGGQQELTAKVYETAYLRGYLANLPLDWAKTFDLELNGKTLRMKVINLSKENEIVISNFYTL